jgi:prepilin-type N-terminal cleavage/methylation domain-containing protein
MKLSHSRGFTLVELMITLTILSILVTMEHPIFEAFQIRAKQAEAKANLKGIYTAKIASYGETDTFSCETAGLAGSTGDSFCGWSTNKTTRYSYRSGIDSRLATLKTTEDEDLCNADNSLNPVAEKERSFTVTAVGQIDSDTLCDQWSINHKGTMVNDVNDVALGEGTGDAYFN